MQRTSSSNHLSTEPLPAVVAAQGDTTKPTVPGDERHVSLDVDVPGTRPEGGPAPQAGLLMQVLSKLNCPSLPAVPSCPDGKAVRECFARPGVSSGIAAFIVTGIGMGVPFMLLGGPDEWLLRAGIVTMGAVSSGGGAWLAEKYGRLGCCA